MAYYLPWLSNTSGGGGSYDIATVIANIRANADYGSYWTDTTEPAAPNGLQLPDAPQGTLTDTPVSTLAALRTAVASGSGKAIRVTDTPVTFTVGDSNPALSINLTDSSIDLTDVTFACASNNYGFTVDWRSQRVSITGGSFDSGFEVKGRDIKIKDTTNDVAITRTSGNANTGLVGGHRICWERCYSSMYNGGPGWADVAKRSEITASISGTTLTVTSLIAGVTPQVGFSVTAGGMLQGTTITADLGGNQYTVSRSQTVTSRTMECSERSTNIILANTIAIATVGSNGSHENLHRMNSGHLGLEVDSRFLSYVTNGTQSGGAKPTLRATSNSTTFKNTKTIGSIRCQHEGSGITTPALQGIYPNVENCFVDGSVVYRTPDTPVSNGGGAVYPEPTANHFASISGNGTTATVVYDSAQQAGHGLTSGDTVSISNGGSFNATNVTITVVDSITFTYSSSATGSGGCTVNTSKVSCDFFWMKNTEVYGQPGATAGTGWTNGAGVRGSWTTVTNAATSLANGNVFRDYVSPPAWSYRTVTP